MILGLTGGIATGKSTVSNIFREKGYTVIDADLISREIAEDSDVLKVIGEKFGKEMIKENRLNRLKMREVIFKEKNMVEELNAIMHPPIIKKLEMEIKKHKDEKLIVADIPLLFEKKLEYLVDKILVVVCKNKIQIERIIARDNVNKENAINIIDKQFDLEIKKEKSDYIIENSMGVGELKIEVEELLKKLRK